MKVLLLNGLSGSGKSFIAKEMVNRNPDNYKLIKSFTTRPKRDYNDTDHIFVSKSDMLRGMVFKKYVARTTINDNFYCAFESQFDDEKINIYIVDDYGVLDLKNNMQDADILTIRIIRDNINVDDDRKRRFKYILPNSCSSFDYIIENNGTIDEVINKIEDSLPRTWKIS